MPEQATERSGSGMTTLELREADLQPQTVWVQVGTLRFYRRVVTEMRTVQVPIRRQELVIEHLEADPSAAVQAAEPTHGSQIRELEPGQVIRVLLAEEELVIDKRPVVTEEVEIGKRVTQATRSVSASVEREELRVRPAR